MKVDISVIVVPETAKAVKSRQYQQRILCLIEWQLRSRNFRSGQNEIQEENAPPLAHTRYSLLLHGLEEF